ATSSPRDEDVPKRHARPERGKPARGTVIELPTNPLRGRRREFLPSRTFRAEQELPAPRVAFAPAALFPQSIEQHYTISERVNIYPNCASREKTILSDELGRG